MSHAAACLSKDVTVSDPLGGWAFLALLFHRFTPARLILAGRAVETVSMATLASDHAALDFEAYARGFLSLFRGCIRSPNNRRGMRASASAMVERVAAAGKNVEAMCRAAGAGSCSESWRAARASQSGRFA